MPKSYLVGARAEFTDGHRKVLSCDGTEIGVFMTGGQLVAWHNECPHRGGPVCQGRLYKRVMAGGASEQMEGYYRWEDGREA